MEDTQVNKTDRQAGRDSTLPPMYDVCDENYKQKQDSNIEKKKKNTSISKHTRPLLDLYNQPNTTS